MTNSATQPGSQHGVWRLVIGLIERLELFLNECSLSAFETALLHDVKHILQNPEDVKKVEPKILEGLAALYQRKLNENVPFPSSALSHVTILRDAYNALRDISLR